MGYSEMLLAELFCNGIPLSETVNGFFTYTKALTNNEVYAIALTHLDSALATAIPVAGNTRADTLFAANIKNAASIAKGRVLVDLGRFSDAAVAVASVPTNYTYNVTFSQATNDNNVWGLAGQVSTRARFVVGDSFDTQGTTKNALPFSSAKDPRVPTTGSPTANGTKAIDGITPLVSQQIWVNRSDPIPVATGIDARLIEAEAKLNANDIAGMMTILNALRATSQSIGPITVPSMAALATPAPEAGCGSSAVAGLREGIGFPALCVVRALRYAHHCAHGPAEVARPRSIVGTVISAADSIVRGIARIRAACLRRDCRDVRAFATATSRSDGHSG